MSTPQGGELCLIFAAYKDGAVMSIKTAEAKFKTAEEIIVPKPGGFVTDGADKVRVMMWKSFTDIKPLCEDDTK